MISITVIPPFVLIWFWERKDKLVFLTDKHFYRTFLNGLDLLLHYFQLFWFMSALRKFLLLNAVLFAMLQLMACQKYSDTIGPSDPRLNGHYCNDPDAVNFNKGFPGIADNSVCIYPSDVFAGTYTFVDSVYDGGQKLLQEVPLSLSFSAQNHTKFQMQGFCLGGAAINFTTNRTLLASVDSSVSSGQLLCRPADTLSGTIYQKLGDTTRVYVSLVVLSDTGVSYHQGTAFRQ